MATQSDWFVRERSEAVASLLLTNREDVTVLREDPRDTGADLLVQLKEDTNKLSTMLFVVQVRGTLSEDKVQWMEGVKQLFNAGPVYLPACVFVVNVRNSNAEYAWLAKPKVEEKGAKLDFYEHGEFQPLTPDAVDQIVNHVQAWYQALPQTPAAQST